MTPPRGVPHLTERPSETRERSSEGAESSRDLAGVLVEQNPVALDSLRRFDEREGDPAPGAVNSLHQFQDLSQARTVLRGHRESYNPFFILKRWTDAWFAASRPGMPVETVVDPTPNKTPAEILGLQARSGLDRELFRLRIARRMESQGYLVEALQEVVDANIGMLALGATYRSPQSSVVFLGSFLADITPQEILLGRAMVEQREIHARLLEKTQQPVMAAEIYGVGAVQIEALRKHQPKNELPAFADQYEWFSYRAHRLYYQAAEREPAPPQDEPPRLYYVWTSTYYERAARLSKGAKAYQDKAFNRGDYTIAPVISEKFLLKKALDGYLQAGMSEDAQRVRDKLRSLGVPG